VTCAPSLNAPLCRMPLNAATLKPPV